MHHAALPVRLKGRRFAPAAVAALALAAVAAPGANAAPSPIVVDAAHDSVIVTGLPFGAATLQVTRPDLKSGKPDVIGQFQGFAFPGLPFSANTTTPTPFNPGGDCWQKGAVTLPNSAGLTPDILPGDTVSVVGGPSVTVPADAPLTASDGSPSGPIAGCANLSLWAHNAFTDATFASPGSDLAVTGQAQPLATNVAVTATDANGVATDPVDATLASDGSYTATVPASSLSALANGELTLSAAYTVPDVASGAPVDIAGQTLSVDKETPAPPAASGAPAPAGSGAGPAAPAAPAARIALNGLVVRRKITLGAAQAGKLRASFVVPTGAKYARVRLSRPGHTAALVIVPTAKAGSRQVIALPASKLKKLKRGTYTVTVGTGPLTTQFVAPTLRGSIRVY
jgi:hypothetical protein